ncbi:MAG: class I tRNA ligase family protein [Planctomycetaceae bacterium]
MSGISSKTYDPASAQSRWIQHWESQGYCNADPKPDREAHTIMIPLPNVTGALHMGHCLNGTLQDLLTRWRRMQGYEALWMPGTDRTGIATQAVVERRMLEEEGLTRRDIGRDALVERIWKWKDQYEQRILNQLKQIGESCDWRRVRFTLDDVCSKAVHTLPNVLRRVDFSRQAAGQQDTHATDRRRRRRSLQRRHRRTLLDIQLSVVDDNGQPTGQKISFSTTRPETMLGDTAVCVHPQTNVTPTCSARMFASR